MSVIDLTYDVIDISMDDEVYTIGMPMAVAVSEVPSYSLVTKDQSNQSKVVDLGIISSNFQLWIIYFCVVLILLGSFFGVKGISVC